ncbi:Predicted acyl esterase [gamma proteobacterium HdN1]|nr:Predicted acyl esterase [gamma proteobacterium HdN1]
MKWTDKRFGRTCLALAISSLLIACSGGSSSNSSQTNDTQTGATDTTAEENITVDTPETNQIDAQSRANLTATGGAIYRRDAEYRYAVSLPLRFVEASNGKKLAVRVTLPANEKGVPAPGAFPVILTQGAYNGGLLSTMFMGIPGNLLLGVTDSFVVRRGYVQVSVDAMGTGASEGGWELLGADEQQGFADIVDWVDEQPWSNGKLGVAGVSYMGISSLFAAESRPDKIDAVFASLPAGDVQRGIVGVGGMLNAVFMSEWMFITHTTSTQNVPNMLTSPRNMAQLIRSTDEHVAQVDKYFLPLIDDALYGAPYVTYDSDFWRTRSPSTNINKIKAPTFILGALDDLFQRDQPLLFDALDKNGVDAKLVVFGGTHMANFIKPHVGSEVVPPIDFLMLQWFDKHLRGMETGIEKSPKVVQFVKNYPSESTPEAFRNDSLITTSAWPHPEAQAERWYLHGDMSLDQAAPTSTENSPLMTQPEHPKGEAHNSKGLLAFNVEINDGTKCSRSHLQWVLGLEMPKNCQTNTNRTEQQRLVFDSAPMPEDYFINGPITAEVWIDSTVTDAAVSVSVEEVSKKRSLPITDGQLLASVRAVDESRSRFLNGQMIQPYHYLTEEKAQALVPGQVVKMQIEIFSTAALIRKGNKLRIAISPSNQAQSMINYPRQDLMSGGVTTLHLSPEYPSSVVLPIVPLSAMN